MKFSRGILDRIGTFLDYNYFRVAKIYFKKEGSFATTALIHVCLLVSLSFAPVIILSLIFISAKLKIPNGTGTIYVKIGSIVYCLVIYQIISKRYNKRGTYLKLRDKWDADSQKTKFIGGVVVILSILIPLFICILILINRDNIKVFFLDH